jgi:hypothetical protein
MDLHNDLQLTEQSLIVEITQRPARLEERKDIYVKGKYFNTTPLLAWSIRSYIEKDKDWKIVNCLLQLGASIDAADSVRKCYMYFESLIVMLCFLFGGCVEKSDCIDVGLCSRKYWGYRDIMQHGT